VADGAVAPEESSSEGTILWLMKRGFAQQRRAVEDAMRAHGITAPQAGVLSQLHRSPGLSSSDMARHLIITPQAVMAAVASLETLGLLERADDPNHGRIRRCFLTDEGRRVAAACEAAAQEVEEKLLAALDDEQRQTFAELLVLYIRDH
jgi:DNA-binding MarR family transcriptional regulator